MKEPLKYQEANTTSTSEKRSLGRKIGLVIRRNPVPTLWLIILMVGFTWYSVKNYSTKRALAKEKSELISQYELQLDSVILNNIELTSRDYPSKSGVK